MSEAAEAWPRLEGGSRLDGGPVPVKSVGLPGPYQSTMRVGMARATHGSPPSGMPINRALDLLTFFLADVQTGFGPFIAIYLTANQWTPTQIGLALSTGTLVSILAQVPAGALIDFLPRKRFGAIAALVSICVSALLIARFPSVRPVLTAQALHGVASCLLVPAIAAITLSRVGRAALAVRLGRNARFAALGNAAGAALMGAAGTYWSAEAVLWLAAAFCLPAIFVLFTLPSRVPPDIAADMRANTPPAPPIHHAAWGETRRVLTDHRLLMFAGCIVLFHLANAAMLPLAASALTVSNPRHAILVVAACLIVPQGIVALCSPTVGRLAQTLGRRPVLLVGFAMLPLRAGLLAFATTPGLVIATQALDGIGGAVFGIMLPLIASDVSAGTNRFNLSIGTFGLAASIGATLSTTFAGYLATGYGNQVAYGGLAVAGLLAVLLVEFAMPETLRRGRHNPEGAVADSA